MIIKLILNTFIAIMVLFVIFMMLPDTEEDAVTEDHYIEAEAESKDSDEVKDESKDDPVVKEDDKGSDIQKTDIEAISVGTDAESATVMIYMNGSDLETNNGAASEDISEMLASGVGENVKVVIQTMGTRKWQDHGISSKTAQTYLIEDDRLNLVRDDLGQLDCTSEDTLSEFIGFCKEEYPSDRYMFLFWDHGGGPVYGFGYDEWQSEESSLTLAEMAQAFSEHRDVSFDIIGMDCCIMGNLETCFALAPFCKYTILSEDFENGSGWSYTEWMNAFEADPGMSTPILGKCIVDSVIKENEESFWGESACLGLYNESTVNDLFNAWKDYAYKNEDALFGKNYSKVHKARGRGYFDQWGIDGSDVTMSDYYISDIMALVESIDNDSEEAKKLISSLKAAVAYYGHTSDKNELTGLSVSLPYGDPYFYERLKDVYTDLDFDSEYIDWLNGFAGDEDYDDYYDFEDFEDSWDGWGSYEQDYGCNISGGGSCEYGYSYDDQSEDDWIYDYEEDIWYLYEDDILYLYDEESDTVCYYDEYEDQIYAYDEETDSWDLIE